MDRESEISAWFNGLAWGAGAGLAAVIVIFVIIYPHTIEDGMIQCKMEADHCDQVWQVFVAEQELKKLKEQLK